jgi:hypothetical protein
MIDHWIVETCLFKLSIESSYWSHCSSQEQQHWKHLIQETESASQSLDTQCLFDRKFDIKCSCVDDDSATCLKS